MVIELVELVDPSLLIGSPNDFQEYGGLLTF